MRPQIIKESQTTDHASGGKEDQDVKLVCMSNGFLLAS